MPSARILPAVCLMLAICLLLVLPPATRAGVSIIPKPMKVEMQQGSFTLNPRTLIAYHIANREMADPVQLLAGELRRGTGFPLKVVDAARLPKGNMIFFNYIREEELGSEGYVLRVTKDAVYLEANQTPGFFYAAQTLLQLLPPEVFGTPTKGAATRWSIPCMTVTDTPRYAWRGMMLDCCRHFFPKEFVKRFIDELVMHKMNTFHWHLTEDQGWRIEIKKYPRLTEVGAWRANKEDVSWSVRPGQLPGEQATYGGFYTQDDVREVVAYAAARHITVVPEIEMPAHATAALASYPWLSCTGGPFTVTTGGVWPITDIYCAGNDSTFMFLEDVLTEVASLFPGSIIHIGGDEAAKDEWKKCPKCQARIKAEGLKNEEELQSYFIRRVEGIVKKLGKRIIGWDEILEGGLAPEATVMSWRGTAGGIAAARARHDVVMTPTSNCYVDYYQADPRIEPVCIGGYLPLENVYRFEPTPDSLTAEEAPHILGAQGNLWTEYIPDSAKVEYMVFPRIAAMAEVVWSPREQRDWEDFTTRLRPQLARYRAAGINYATSAYGVSVADSFDAAGWRHYAILSAQVAQKGIRYTLDGKDPGPSSAQYRGPIPLPGSTVVKAATFIDGKQAGRITAQEILLNRKGLQVDSLWAPLGANVSGRSPSGLVDNIHALPAVNDSNWRKVRQKDLDVIIDLGSISRIRRLSAGFLHCGQASVFLPVDVTYSVSNNGIEFRTVANVPCRTTAKEMRTIVEQFTSSFPSLQARYVRVQAQNMGTVPPWHKQAGQPAWMFVDEVVVE